MELFVSCQKISRRSSSGLELQEALRSRGHRTPVIVITAFPNEIQRKRAVHGGAVGFLSKPFDEASLIGCLTVAIKLRELDAREKST
jgi:FixJ family two-component response regulator